MEHSQQDAHRAEDVAAALDTQRDEEAHDRSLIVERLSWTPEQRLQANTAFLRFYFQARPAGPLMADE